MDLFILTDVILPIFILWTLIVSGIVSSYGSKRKIGGAAAFFASILFSPVIAMLFVLASDKVVETDKEENPTNEETNKNIFIS